MIREFVMFGRALESVMVCGPAPGMLNSMVSWAAVPLASEMALLSEPAPVRFVLMTVKVAARLVAHASAEMNSARQASFFINKNRFIGFSRNDEEKFQEMFCER